MLTRFVIEYYDGIRPTECERWTCSDDINGIYENLNKECKWIPILGKHKWVLKAYYEHIVFHFSWKLLFHSFHIHTIPGGNGYTCITIVMGLTREFLILLCPIVCTAHSFISFSGFKWGDSGGMAWAVTICLLVSFHLSVNWFDSASVLGY